jgi:hypothetical protein
MEKKKPRKRLKHSDGIILATFAWLNRKLTPPPSLRKWKKEDSDFDQHRAGNKITKMEFLHTAKERHTEMHNTAVELVVEELAVSDENKRLNILKRRRFLGLLHDGIESVFVQPQEELGPGFELEPMRIALLDKMRS